MNNVAVTLFFNEDSEASQLRSNLLCVRHAMYLALASAKVLQSSRCVVILIEVTAVHA